MRTRRRLSLLGSLIVTLAAVPLAHASTVQTFSFRTHIRPAQQTDFGPGDPRNYSSYWLHVYEGELASLIGGGRLVAGWFGAPLGTSHFFQQNLNHWWEGSGSPIDVPATDPVAQELHDDPFVADYYGHLSDSGWAWAVRTWIVGQAAVIPCGTTGSTEVSGPISYQQTREGIGLVFKQFNGIYGVGKPWMTTVNTDALIKRNPDGSITYTATGDAKIFKAWGWPTDPYSTWSDWDLNFKSWYIEYYGGAHAFPLTVDLGNFSWSGKIPAANSGECAPVKVAHPTYGAPINLTGPNGQSIDGTGHVSISQNGQYVAVEGGISGYTELYTGGGYAYGGSTAYTGFTYSGRNGVNNSGEVAGWNGSCSTPEVFKNGQAVTLTAKSGTTPDECGVGNLSNNGNLVGDGNDSPPNYYATSWLYKAATGTYVNLQSLSPGHALMQAGNDGGTVVGESIFTYGSGNSNWADTLWSNGNPSGKKIGPPPLASGWVPQPEDINNNNLIVGGGFYAKPSDTSDDDHAFESANGAGYVDLGALAEIPAKKACSSDGSVCNYCGQFDKNFNPVGDYSQSEALSVNSEGDIAGDSIVAPANFSVNNPDCGDGNAVIWPKGATSPTNLNSVIPKKTGWVLTQATGISDTGDVVGIGTDNGKPAGFLLAGPQKLSGTVAFSDDTRPATKIVVKDAEQKVVATEFPDGTGYWSVTLPANSYKVSLESLPKGYSAENGSTLTADLIGGPAVVDFAIAPDPPACATIDTQNPDGCGPNGYYEPTRETNGVGVTTQTVPVAISGKPYSAKLSDTGGVKPLTWTLASGSKLPSGLSLSSSGVISGSPKNTALSVDSFAVEVTDSSDPVENDFGVLSDVVLPKGSSSSEVTGFAAASTVDGKSETVSGGPGTSTPDDTVTGSGGSGTITDVAFKSDPEPGASPVKNATYATVALGPDAKFASVKVSVCASHKLTRLAWYNLGKKAWLAVTSTGTTASGKSCRTFVAGAKTSPSLAELSGATFAAGS